MAFMTEPERALARAISELELCNPFLPERIEAERRALRARFVPTGPVWHTRPVPLDVNPNVARLAERAATLADKLRERLAAGADPGPDRALYEDLVTYLLYHRVEPALYTLVTGEGASTGRLGFYPQFAREVRRYLDLPALAPPAPGPTRAGLSPTPLDAPHLLAFFFQIRRAFHFTIENILGGSLPAARLRAAVWQAIFTRDMRRYRRGLHQRMHDITTLIVGPTGTGKELVALAQRGDVREEGMGRLPFRRLEDPGQPGLARRLRVVALRRPRRRHPAIGRDGTDGARRPPAAGEGRQRRPAAGEHHRRRLPRPDGLPHREHRPPRRPPEEGDHPRRGPRQPARAAEERRAPHTRPRHHAAPA